MVLAALLLTGGASRRMGSDKAMLAGPDGRCLAERTAALLAMVADPVLEVGPGRGGIDSVVDARPGAGPLAAVATGVAALAAAGRPGPALVVATDLPRLDTALLVWLADHPAPGTVVPVVDGRPQLLCARYDAETLDRAAGLVASGYRRMQDLLAGRPWHAAGPEEWGKVPGDGSLRDADTPMELAALLAGAPSDCSSGHDHTSNGRRVDRGDGLTGATG
jgi:molybdopterin-guanine dinucleotide biosynthesis protein A